MNAAREWWRYNVEDPLSRLSIDWDTWFLYAWTMHMVGVILSGGAS
jgi:hypothetical protein